jgi:hypothetical protein
MASRSRVLVITVELSREVTYAHVQRTQQRHQHVPTDINLSRLDSWYIRCVKPYSSGKLSLFEAFAFTQSLDCAPHRELVGYSLFHGLTLPS